MTNLNQITEQTKKTTVQPYSKGNNNECYTYDYAVKPILPYIPEDKVIWCPFDTAESEFVKQISKTNKVIFSHLDNGQDFFEYEPEEHWDIIISNPPFTKKKEIFQRALSFGKPFALIMTMNWLNDGGPYQVFKDTDFELMIFNKRMRFDMQNGKDNNSPTFGSGYYCHNFLPQQIVFEELDIPSRRKRKTTSVNNTNYENKEVA